MPTKNPRILEIKFQIQSTPFLLINTYFPCDPRIDNFDDTELINLLSDIKVLIENSGCTNVLLTGDLNIHFERSTRFTQIVLNQLEDLQLNLLWHQPEYSVDYTYSCMQNNNLHFSTIDHFALSKRMLDSVFEGGVIHSGENLSKHSAICLKLDSGQLNLQLERPQPVKKTCWINATEEAKELFKYTLASKINDLPRYECISCHDLTCQKVIHHSGIENYTLDLLDAMESSGHECLPIIETSGNSKNSRILGWSQHVKPYADDSKFWYRLWLSAGKPLQGELFINMKISRRQFKYAVKRLKRCEDKLKNEKFLNSLCLLYTSDAADE